MRLAVPDLISNSYFPSISAVELGDFADQGLEMTHELIFPVDKCYEVLRDGEVDFIGGSAHATLSAFPGWQGAKLLCALSQGMYWFLVMRTDLGIARGDLAAIGGRRIGAAPWVEYGLRRMLKQAGVDPERQGVDIRPVPGAVKPGVSFGVAAAKALENGDLDGFWANGMGAEIAVTRGVGTVVIDVRRGDGPVQAFNYTQPVLVATDATIAGRPETAAAAVCAIVATQKKLKADVSLAAGIGEKLFSPDEAGLIAGVVERDLPYYSPAITEDFVTGMNVFAREMGFLDRDVGYDDVVAPEFRRLWTE